VVVVFARAYSSMARVRGGGRKPYTAIDVLRSNRNMLLVVLIAFCSLQVDVLSLVAGEGSDDDAEDMILYAMSFIRPAPGQC
jgi:hypothetical protein